MRLYSKKKIESIKSQASIDIVNKLIREFSDPEVVTMTPAQTVVYLLKVRDYLLKQKG